MNFLQEIWFEIRVLFKKFSYLCRIVSRFFKEDIWKLNPSDLSKAKAKAVRDVKIIILMLRTFSAQKIGLHAKALSYLCMMSFVPLVAVVFFLAGNVGLSETVNSFLVENLKDPQMLHILTNSANNIIETGKSGWFGLITSLTFVWIVIWMMICVERVFNSVWQVRLNRNFIKRISVVLIILVTMPLIIAIFFLGSVIYSHVLDLLLPSKIAFSDSIKTFFSWIIFAISSIMVISTMYKFIPATRVKYKYAFKTAIVAGIVFTLVQYLYLETQVFFVRQSAVYGALAALPLFLVWLNVGWTIVLYGAELTYAFQTIDMEKVTDQVLDERIEATRPRHGKQTRYTEMSEIIEGNKGRDKVSEN